MVTVALMCVVAIAALPFMNGNFIPQLREGHYIVHMGLAPGTSLGESMRIGTQVSKALMRVPACASWHSVPAAPTMSSIRPACSSPNSRSILIQ